MFRFNASGCVRRPLTSPFEYSNKTFIFIKAEHSLINLASINFSGNSWWCYLVKLYWQQDKNEKLTWHAGVVVQHIWVGWWWRRKRLCVCWLHSLLNVVWYWVHHANLRGWHRRRGMGNMLLSVMRQRMGMHMCWRRHWQGAIPCTPLSSTRVSQWIVRRIVTWHL